MDGYVPFAHRLPTSFFFCTPSRHENPLSKEHLFYVYINSPGGVCEPPVLSIYDTMQYSKPKGKSTAGLGPKAGGPMGVVLLFLQSGGLKRHGGFLRFANKPRQWSTSRSPAGVIRVMATDTHDSTRRKRKKVETRP